VRIRDGVGLEVGVWFEYNLRQQVGNGKNTYFGWISR